MGREKYYQNRGRGGPDLVEQAFAREEEEARAREEAERTADEDDASNDTSSDDDGPSGTSGYSSYDAGADESYPTDSWS